MVNICLPFPMTISLKMEMKIWAYSNQIKKKKMLLWWVWLFPDYPSTCIRKQLYKRSREKSVNKTVYVLLTWNCLSWKPQREQCFTEDEQILQYAMKAIPSRAGSQSPKSPFLPASAPASPQSSWAAQPERKGELHCKTQRHNVSHWDITHLCTKISGGGVYSINYISIRRQWGRDENNKVIFRGCQQSAGNYSSPLSSLFISEETIGLLASSRDR